MSHRQNIDSGTRWEAMAGYSRAVRIGNSIWVSGTTATDPQGNVVGPGDAREQTLYILKKIELALHEAGASLSDVVRTRIFITDIHQWEAVARAHGEVLGAIRPANTLVQVSALVGDEYLVEIEADAMVQV
jgi:enamine deaminase RidA (YjgF/YER057c/UK114 family)